MASHAESQLKRRHLTETAAALVHRKGFSNTSLADIAAEACIPLGSVHFYFPTKEQLAGAIMDMRVSIVQDRLARWDSLKKPRTRLASLADVWLRDKVSDTRHGCPMGSLCYELGKDSGTLGQLAARPFTLLLAWCTRQFAAMGLARSAHRHAIQLLCSLQGMGILANALKDPKVIETEARQIKAWLRTLESGARAA
jgi:TetR/AcrR family transcriptional repressor of nem operon